jgi:hypothetical protein
VNSNMTYWIKNTIALFLFLIFGASQLSAQPANDDSLNSRKQSRFASSMNIDTNKTANAQQAAELKEIDTTSYIQVVAQTERKGLFAWRDSVIIPKRSAFYALIFPGLGQINNKDYWKLPIVYGAMGVSVYFFVYNTSNYNDARREIAYRMDKGQHTYQQEKYRNWDIKMVQGDRDYYKRFLDMTALLTVAGYGLQVMEANAAAHLKGFDISDDISMQIRPSAMPTPMGLAPGLTLAFKTK